jgi:C1A family cysteine protease
MVVFDPKTKKLASPDWSKLDRGFELIEKTLRQKATNVGTFDEHVISEYTPVSDQGGHGSCVANAWCDMLEILDGLEGSDEIEQLSRAFLYWIARYLHGATNSDSGTYLRAAAHQLRKIGIVEERFYPYKSENIMRSPELDLYMMASNNRLNSFYRISDDKEIRQHEIELAIRANHPVVFGTPVDNDFIFYRGEDVVIKPPSSWVGRHAMIVTGIRYYNGRWSYRWRNSWGVKWGDNGHCWVDQDYMLWDETEDLWVGTRMPPLV